MPGNSYGPEQTSCNLSFLRSGDRDLRTVGDPNSPFVVTMDERFLMRSDANRFVVLLILARISHDKIVGAGRCARPEKVLTGLGWLIKWDGVCISRMGGHGGPPLRTKPVQRRSSERS